MPCPVYLGSFKQGIRYACNEITPYHQNIISAQKKVGKKKRKNRIFNMQVIHIHQICRYQAAIEKHGEKYEKGQCPSVGKGLYGQRVSHQR